MSPHDVARRALAVLSVALLASACGGDGGTSPDDGDRIASVVVSPSSGSVEVGATLPLSATVKNERGEIVTPTITWTSGATGVASVDGNGVVRGVSEGTATITASAGGKSGTAVVAVTDPNPPAAPSDVTAVAASDEAVDVGWTDNANNEDEFRIEREEVGAATSGSGPARVLTQVATVGANQTSYRDDGLSPNTTYRYLVRACNDNGCAPEDDDPAAMSGDVATFETLVWAATELSGGTVGVPYSETLTASGGDGTFTWSIAAGALPDGLSLNGATGVLAGTPTAGGSFDFTIQVQSGGQTVSQAFTVEIVVGLGITTTSLPDGVVDAAYAATLEAIGGDGAYAWAVVDGALPDGLDLDGATGEITGTPTAVGTNDFTVEVTSAGESVTADLSIEVTEVVAPVITNALLPDGQLGAAYVAKLNATGGNGTYTFAVVEGALPDGLSLNGATGTIAGTPTVPGDFDFTVEVSSAGLTGQKAFSISVTAPPVTVDTDFLPGAYVGSFFSAGIEASGGDGTTYAFALANGVLPTGLSLDAATGALTGTTTASGVFYFTVQATSGGQTGARTFAVWVSPNPESAFNLVIENVASGTTIPSTAVRSALQAALIRWEDVITGDLEDWGYTQDAWEEGECDGYGPILNGQVFDDMVIFLNLDAIDGPGNKLGSGGPCDGRIVGTTVNTTVGRLTLDTGDLNRLSAHQAFSLMFHEIAHIMGIGTWWSALEGPPVNGTNLITGKGGADPRYTGAGGNGVYTGELGGGSSGTATQIPIEADGDAGTRDGHWDEGEFDKEIMTGWIENSGTMPISSMTIAAIGDLAYVVDTDAADDFAIPACAPSCGTTNAPPAAVAGTGDLALGDDIRHGPVRLTLPDGRVIRFEPRYR